MKVSFLTFLTFQLVFVESNEFKKHVPNSVYPYDLDPPSYNIGSWAKLLHLQQCALVEVGDRYYAIFVESRPRRYDKEKNIKEYFLGLCDDDTLRKWPLCSSNLQRKRSKDCNFATNNMYGTRVHRRLCDVTLLAHSAPQCDCNSDLSDSKLYKVQGFPTCFKAPLPDSLCGDNNVCGLAACAPETVNKQIHSVRCDKSCYHQQPFCEQPGKRSSQPRPITSFWTDWSNPFCTDVSCLSQYDEATCVNRETGEGDIDCLGPGTSCCSPDLQNCRCHIYEEDGTSKVFRTFSIPPPELVEYMSEEDFINSIPLRLLSKEEYNKYPYNNARTLRSNFGQAFKQTIYDIYDRRPLKFGNTHKTKKRVLHGIKNNFNKLSQISNSDKDRIKRTNNKGALNKELIFSSRRKLYKKSDPAPDDAEDDKCLRTYQYDKANEQAKQQQQNNQSSAVTGVCNDTKLTSDAIKTTENMIVAPCAVKNVPRDDDADDDLVNEEKIEKTASTTLESENDGIESDKTVKIDEGPIKVTKGDLYTRKEKTEVDDDDNPTTTLSTLLSESMLRAKKAKSEDSNSIIIEDEDERYNTSLPQSASVDERIIPSTQEDEDFKATYNLYDQEKKISNESSCPSDKNKNRTHAKIPTKQ